MIRAILAAVVLSIGSPTLAQSPLIIAHRGASGERPEHTRAAYELAIAQGADIIEPDLVMTQDGHLVVRHENEIGETTDVADHPAFANRRTTRTIDGRPVTGWFTEDFTLAELQTLRARERLPQLRPANTAFDGTEPILTFQQVIDIARKATARTGRIIGIAPELKHPSHFLALGLDMEGAFVRTLRDNGLTSADAPVLVQCFEVAPLRRLAAVIDTPLVQLMAPTGSPPDRPDVAYAAMAMPDGLAQIATYAEWIGVETTMIEPRDAAGAALPPTTLIADAHSAGLKVAAWTFRAENYFLPLIDRSHPTDLAAPGNLPGMVSRFEGHGVDAVFTDHPGQIAPSPHGQGTR